MTRTRSSRPKRRHRLKDSIARRRRGRIESIPALETELSNSSRVTRLEAVQALAEIHAVEALKPLGRALRDGDIVIRHTAARAIARFDDKEALELLIPSLRDGAPSVRIESERALLRKGQQQDEVRRWLVSLLASRSSETPRVEIVRILAEIRDDTLIPYLRALLRDANEEVRAAAGVGLRRIREHRPTRGDSVGDRPSKPKRRKRRWRPGRRRRFLSAGAPGLGKRGFTRRFTPGPPAGRDS